MDTYTVRLSPNDSVVSIQADNEADAVDRAVDMATGGYADLWELLHHCHTEVEIEEE